MNFVHIGEMVNRLSDACKTKNSHIEWDKIRAFRNLVAHDYFGIDAEEVWQIVTEHLPEFLASLKEIQHQQFPPSRP